MGLMLVLPLATFYAEHLGVGHELVLTAFSFDDVTNPAAPVQVTDTIYLGVILTLAALLPLAGIFMFKNRRFQLRLCLAEWILLVGSAGFLAYYIYILKGSFDVVTWKLGYASFFVIMAAIFNGLAQRGIMKDIKLLRSIDRIR